jgi:uncharacterized protein (DUF305 family)
MRKRTAPICAAALAALIVSAGCSSSGSELTAGQTTSTVGATPTTTSTSEAHNMADVMFAQHMIPHHQQAIEMSDIVSAKPDIDPRVIDLASQIKAAQGPEIQQMWGWLNQWGIPAMPSMPSGHMDMPGDMPGMAGMMSEEDIAALKNAQGIEASKLFLTQMIQHHEGAITMAQNEIDNGQYPATIELARSIVTTQQREIDTMRGILPTL